MTRNQDRSRGRLRLRLAALTLTLAAAAAAPAAAQTATYDDAAYWRFADRMQLLLEPTWDGEMEIYRPGGGGVDTSVNANLLLTHSVAAREGHSGASRNDQRARALVRRFVSPPAFITQLRGTSRNRHAPGWSNSMRGSTEQHLVYDADVVEALAAAFRARRELDLPASSVEAIRDRIRRVANGSYWRFPTLRLNQISWYLLVAAANATVNGADRTLAHDFRARVGRFASHARHNFGPGLRFHYLPDEHLNHPMNVDSAEYANIVLSFTRFYGQARRAGMGRLPAAQRALIRRWILRAIAGYWTHGGYLNWDSGLGFERWHQGKKLGLVQQALIGIATAQELRPSGSGRWAKHVLDRGFDLYARWSERAGGLPDPVAFDVSAVPQTNGSARLAASRMQGNAARAVDAGLGDMGSSEPPALYAYDPDIGRLAVTTPVYNTAIVAVNQRAFPYGGIELARLYDSRQDVAGNIGGRGAAAFGIHIRDLHGRQVMSSQTGRAAVSRSTTPLRLVSAPSGTRARASSPVGAAFAGRFARLRAIGTARAGGFRVVTRHTFTPKAIDERWSVTGATHRRVSVDALFPSTGRGATITAVLRDGRRITVGGTRIALDRIARFEIRSRDSGYTVTPLSRPRAATAHVLQPSRQSSAPNPGPTLAIQLVRAARVRTAAFAARVRVGV